MKHGKQEYFFDLSDLEGLDIESIAIRETDGNDERNAVLNVKAKGEKSTSIAEELINFAIVEVNGSRTPPAGAPMADWNTRTRNFVRQLFDGINGQEGLDPGPLLKTRKGRPTSSTSTTEASGETSSG